MILKEFEFLQYKDEAKPHFIKEETFLAIEKFVLDNEERAQYLKITTKKRAWKSPASPKPCRAYPNQRWHDHRDIAKDSRVKRR